MNKVILRTFPLNQMPWQTIDPFLFCVHHLDHYPAGKKDMSPIGSLTGREIGRDFSGKDGWSMYHGKRVPGFPRHPHRGFETITISRQGLIDHSDSMGAKARFGNGDIQWMTAGKGVVHAEMFPLLNQQQSNPAELFQIWLNLPKEDKFVEPYFTMFWRDSIPVVEVVDEDNRLSTIQVVAGQFESKAAPAPPPNSWAARSESDLAIWSITMAPGAKLSIPIGKEGTNRVMYFFDGMEIFLGERILQPGHGFQLLPTVVAELRNGDRQSEILFLQGRPIGDPVVSYGPFVMNSQEEIRQAFTDYQKTGFGGWPWSDDAPVHSRDEKRFAIHANGKKEIGT